MKKTLIIFSIIMLALSNQTIKSQDDAFITTWITNNGFEKISLTGLTGATNYNINWGDGSSNNYTTGQIPEHLYLNSGEYTISFTGSFTHLKFEGQTKLKAVKQWGTRKWLTMENMFKDCINLINLPTQAPDLSLCSSMSGMFNGATSFNQPIGDWDVNNVVDMKYIFFNATSFNQPINTWNVSNVTNMNSMFFGATSFNQPINSWKVSNVMNMGAMFFGATSFNQPIGAWDVTNVTDMIDMFKNVQLSNTNYDELLIGWATRNLKSNIIFNGGKSKYFEGETAHSSMISNFGWIITDGGFDGSSLIVLDTNGVVIKWLYTKIPTPYFQQANPRGTGMEWFAIIDNSTLGKVHDYAKGGSEGRSYFRPPGQQTAIPFNNIITSLVNNMSGTFSGISSFNQPIDSWDVSNVTNMRGMFRNATSFNQPIDSWDVSKVNDMGLLFDNATSFNHTIVSWNVSNVIDMFAIFQRATSFNQPIGDWNVSKVQYMSFMFWSATSFNQPINSWNVSNVMNMGAMFFNATSFNQPIDSWDVSNVTNMISMFYNAFSFNEPIGSWNVSNVIDMNGMFRFIPSFNQPIGDWDVSNVTNMQDMFDGTSSFNQPIGSWNVSNVTNMGSMFKNATSFNRPIDSWNVSNVINISGMFRNASSFNQPINSWNVSKVTNMEYMFFDATSFNQPIDSWNVSNVTDMREMFRGAKLSISNYDATLIGWATRGANGGNLRSNVNFNGGNSRYCNGLGARNYLINTFGWTITDGGLDCSSLNTEEFELVGLKLYPNPTSSILNLNVSNAIANQPYKILDALGKVILKGNLYEADNSINVAKLSKGIYFIKLEGKRAVRFVKD